jgi:SNF2 family DNA or RNA helicase
MLRRLKVDIQELNLPKRIVKEVLCEFENMERDTYETLATRLETSLSRAARVRSFLHSNPHLWADCFQRITM